jgi:two-component sensor histidine kinase
MSVISSIFSLYSADATPQETPIIVADVAEKIQAMSAVHGRLYQSSDLGHLSLSDVIQDIAAIVKDESAATRREVRVDIRREAQISIEVALPLSMVIQQILSTALRLPISKGHTGRVVVALAGDSTAIRVEVESDSATQISENDLRERTGLRMIREIVKKQLHGELLEPETSETEPPRWRLRVPVKDRPD